MIALVNSLKRLYENDKVKKEKLLDMVEKGTITIDDYNKITGYEEM